MTRIINAIMGFCSFALIFMAVGVNDITTATTMLFVLAVCLFTETEHFRGKQ